MYAILCCVCKTLNEISKDYWKTDERHYKSRMDEASQSRENRCFPCRFTFDELTHNFDGIILAQVWS